MNPLRTWDYRAEYDAEREDILAAVDRVFRSGRLILGESVRAFESEFAAYCGVRSGVGLGNGTDAIFLTLRAFGIGRGDEVITVANTAVPTVSAIVATGATPVFVDIEPATYLMDVSRLEAAVGPRTRAIVPVHLFGQCADMEGVNAVAARHGLTVVEDCAQAHGATQHGRRAGSLAHAAAFSFYPTKPLGAYGDGGMVVSDDADLIEHLRRLRFYGMREPAPRGRGRFQLATRRGAGRDPQGQAEAPRWVHRAAASAGRELRPAARGHRACPAIDAAENGHVFYRYVVRHPGRDRLLKGLRQRGIDLDVNYPHPIHLMPAYARPGIGPGSLPATEAAAREMFSLPLYPMPRGCGAGPRSRRDRGAARELTPFGVRCSAACSPRSTGASPAAHRAATSSASSPASP